MSPTAVSNQSIERAILVLRSQKVLLDAELAALYGVTTKRLNEQVKRNLERFPEDFMFRLTTAEFKSVNRSQIATGSQRHRDPRFLPYAFTEHGAIMAANVLASPRDQAIAGILDAIRRLMSPPESKRRPIGFITPEEK